MPQLDDIRSPARKIRPRLLRHIYQPSLFSSWPKPLAYWRWPFGHYRRHWVVYTVLLTTGVATWLLYPQVLPALTRLPDVQTENSGDSITDDTQAQAVKQAIINKDTPLQLDFTFDLRMNINGQPQAIPANFGQLPDGKYIFNSDNTNGDIHVQSPENRRYTLNDFFALWGGQFNEQCLLNHCTGTNEVLTMTVNGQPNHKFSQYVIKPGDRIEITYGSKPTTTPPAP